MADSTTIPFPTQVANAIVRKINFQVDSMLRGSKVVDDKWRQKNDKLGLFEKSELQVGKLLGTGGFSDVYEVCSFSKTESNRTWTYQQSLAREAYKDSAIDRNGKSNYVVKHLKVKMIQDATKFSMAASDLVMEAQFLSNLNHKNILRLRGWASTGIESYSDGSHDGFFLVLDRLEGTLTSLLEKWENENDLTRNLSQLSVNSQGNQETTLLARTKVAHQIADALKYLHSKNIVFRDLKPDNVGFDKFGTVKIFDFGLARELPKECENVNDVYHMSGMIGTLRYMAPEVALSKRYNQKVDTYSWAHLFWSCLALTKPYVNMTRNVYLVNVCKHGQRPAFQSEWPKSICKLLNKSWAQDPYDRITMIEVCAHLDRIEKELQTKLEVISRETQQTALRSSLVRKRSSTFVLNLITQTKSSVVPFVV
mmetsp:Transcript_22367/g.33045  ORF Transcript_22367/g.33045 Transcript_22367/m.33045 type:complete len:424 (+) Transcript_22367:102-1373(+)|eukprot:CAMPEP_0194204320 /NCGR_PEP_ID=MMETSP0156-20130528/3881_1 /TAXON_ID=33649 /ORGANISM="Thalassionema nitzschioides, Strain L26-B" /LENGTH=423 /DNA_ID=CAMNT_0038930309 /DNA_START=90 /DNA_END=1361 /DNA_ORIENTATION=-